MPNWAHLFSLRFAHAIREVRAEGYSWGSLVRDVLAGVTVGIIAIPLAMALAIASGVPPQYGLYTAIVAGIVIALTGGSRFSVSGPTAAFVVILYPITQTYGHGGLLLATLMSGFILIGMAHARLGRFIEYIPESVTVGFTAGIAIVIATLQIKDFMGLSIAVMPDQYLQKIPVLVAALPTMSGASVTIAVATLAVMLAWPRLHTGVPAHLPAVVIATLIGVQLNSMGFSVDTIATRFSYLMPDGTLGAGIPGDLPNVDWPWNRAGPKDTAFVMSWQLVVDLLPSAFAIAMLGAIESLLCAVVLDGMSQTRHSANSELFGQGLGNVVVVFFGGVTATAAIARSTANFRAGAVSPLAAVVHAVVILLALLFLAPMFAYLPMAAMAALLMVVAWNMSEAPKAVDIVRRAPPSDVAVFLVCVTLTVFFDMVIAITAGTLLASVLFMKDIAAMTRIVDITDSHGVADGAMSSEWKVFRISGPLFFAAADRVYGELSQKIAAHRGIILSMEGVPLLDAGGLSAMNKLIDQCRRNGKQVYFTDWQFQPLKTLARARVKPREGVSRFFSRLPDAIAHAQQNESPGTARVLPVKRLET
jgi:sulfate permease, SulP family